ncbi:Polyketide cyclase/dehydrase [Thiorhodococcus drewsii AZ1]|uniref:Polyketide cyclase/dehydrase n=1 Tax=Thiorhodococcus drewsii AZ1 TaxID=765913 RepID=G2E3J2_9GAMM|nr:SRPBCC family protein [Thiorhodococcus drewsii]EGV30105.1 Polyketide cyclase/dehydrase [Thiorhodococcus drewsii AZ1]
MLTSQAETYVARPPELVFQFVAEDFLRNYPRWSPEVRSLEAVTEGPMQVGWIGRQIRFDRGRRSDSQFRVTTFEAGRRITFKGITDSYLIDYRFEPLDCGTQIAFTFELEHLSGALRPFEGMVRRAIQETSERMMVNLKGLIELEVVPQPC